MVRQNTRKSLATCLKRLKRLSRKSYFRCLYSRLVSCQCRSFMLSFLADRQADRPMEWDIRNGVIQRYGRKHGIAVPISDVVVPLLAAGSEGPG